MLKRSAIALALWITTAPTVVFGQSTQALSATLDAQRAAMGRLTLYDGVYTGTWKSFPLDGGRSTGGTTVHRVGPFLGGTVKVMEGRNYTDTGAIVFNGMMILSFDPATRKYSLRIYANGRVIDTEAVMNPEGYHFDVPTPGDASFRRIRITVSPGRWTEQVDYHDGAKPTRKEAELILERVGESDWPLGRPNPTPTPSR